MASRTPRVRRKPKDQYHHGDLRRALLDAARAELRAVGWRELSLRSVARRVGVTHTAAYHHFSDKRDLLATIAVEGLVALYESIEREMAAAGEDPLDRLAAASVGYVKMAFADPTAYELMFVVASPKEGRDFDIHRHMEGKPDAFQQLVQTMQAVLRARGYGEEELMEHVTMQWELVHGIAMLALVGHHERLQVDTLAHTRWVANRMRALFAPA
jgi:AcrR family transcriptional regulator